MTSMIFCRRDSILENPMSPPGTMSINRERNEAGQAGIVDQVSFIVMRRWGITEAFTNDRHFQAAGFRALF